MVPQFCSRHVLAIYSAVRMSAGLSLFIFMGSFYCASTVLRRLLYNAPSFRGKFNIILISTESESDLQLNYNDLTSSEDSYSVSMWRM